MNIDIKKFGYLYKIKLKFTRVGKGRKMLCNRDDF